MASYFLCATIASMDTVFGNVDWSSMRSGDILSSSDVEVDIVGEREMDDTGD